MEEETPLNVDDWLRANSFTMRQLLELHGMVEYLHDSLVTQEIAKILREKGYKHRRVWQKGQWYSVWSDYWSDESTRRSSKKKNEDKVAMAKEIAKRVTSRLPVGRVTVPGAPIEIF
jgi:hypothetical protein